MLWVVDLTLQALVAVMLFLGDRPLWGGAILLLMLVASLPNLFDRRNGVELLPCVPRGRCSLSWWWRR